jgi:mono/diheme cytochrome c family protein
VKCKTRTLGLLFLFLPQYLSLVSGCASRPLSAQEASYPADKVDARGLFAENCIVCHGKNGRAKTFHGRLVGAQNLTDPQFQADTSDAQIIHAIKTGPSVMPAFEKKLSETEIEALAQYVRSFKQTNQVNELSIHHCMVRSSNLFFTCQPVTPTVRIQNRSRADS